MTIQFEGVQQSVAIPQIIANESLYRLSLETIFPRISNRTYEHYFENKIGTSVSVKRPFKARSQTGRVLNKKAALIDKTVDIQIDRRHHYAIETIDEDMTLRIDDYGERYLQTGAEELAYDFDTAGGEELSKTFFTYEGGDNTPLDITRGQLVSAHASKLGIPKRRRFAILDPYEIAAISTDIMTKDIPQMVEGAIRKSFMGVYATWNVLESNFISPMDCAPLAAAAAPLINGAANAVGSSIVTDGWGNAAANTTVLMEGQIITIANVYEVQPRGDRRSTGKLQAFVITEDAVANAAGQATLKISPEIVTPTGVGSTIANPGRDVSGSRNVGGEADGASGDSATIDMSAFQTVSRAPADNAVITVVGMTPGDSAKSYRQGLFMCSDALEYINVKLQVPNSAYMTGSQVDDDTGLAITYTADFEVDELSQTDRLDVLFGVKNIYPEIGMRYISSEIHGVQ